MTDAHLWAWQKSVHLRGPNAGQTQFQPSGPIWRTAGDEAEAARPPPVLRPYLVEGRRIAVVARPHTATTTAVTSTLTGPGAAAVPVTMAVEASITEVEVSIAPVVAIITAATAAVVATGAARGQASTMGRIPAAAAAAT